MNQEMKQQRTLRLKSWIPQNDGYSIEDQTKEVNTAIDSITIEATDNSGQAVTNKVSGLPEGVSFDSATNTISGMPTKVGSYPITVTTTDAEGNATTQLYN